MDATILTTLFCFILLILVILVLNELMILKRKVNAHMDRTDLHSGNLTTILSILQQTEAKLDLIFNNSPPVPGQDDSLSKAVAISKQDAPLGHSWHYPQVCLPDPLSGLYKYTETKVSTSVPEKKAKEPAKKRGRPKRASKA